MREIKFRAWDKRYKFMTDDVYVSGDGLLFEDADKTYDTPNSEIQRAEELIVMQYTGLKDKNGVEIYEGDIARIITLDDSVALLSVVYDEKSAQFWLDSEDWDLPLCNVDNIEIIGNIHENQMDVVL